MKKLTPQTANTFDKVCRLKRDNISLKKFWAMATSGTIIIYKQLKGESPTAQIEIPKKTFEKIVDFYLKG
jgi:hypothetical protein